MSETYLGHEGEYRVKARAGTAHRARRDTWRVCAIMLSVDTLLFGLMSAAYLRLARLSLLVDGVAGLLLSAYLLQGLVLLSGLLMMMGPIRRWQRAVAGPRVALAPAAWAATERVPGRLCVTFAATVAASFLLVDVLLRARRVGGVASVAVIGLFAAGAWLGAFQLSYTMLRTLLSGVRASLSIEAFARDVALPSARGHLWRRWTLTTLALGTVPILLMASVALTLALRTGAASSSRDVITVVFFFVCGLIWIPLAAWFQSGAVAVPLSQVADAITRMSGDSMLAQEPPIVPVISNDELGDLAGSFNQMTGRLKRTLSELNEKQVEQLALLDDAKAKRGLFEVILAHTPVGLALVDTPDYRFRFVNPAYQRFAPGRNLLGRAFAEALPEFAPHAAGTFDAVMRTGAAIRFADEPFRVPRADAPGGIDEIFISVEAVPVYRNGNIESVLLVVEDTTERVRAQQRADQLATIAHHRASELQLVLDNMVDGVIVCDATGRVTMANRAGLQLLGVERVDQLDLDALANRFSMAGAGEERPLPPEERPLRRALAGETLTDFSIVLRRREGGLPRDLRISASPLRDPSGRIVGAVTVSRDVTELTELDRLKDQFIRAAAHELKTPVTIMKVRAQTLLRADGQELAGRRRGLEAIERGADRIAQIVRDLLELSESQLGRLRISPRKADLVPLLDAAIEHARRLTSRHRITRSGEPSAVCDVDPPRIAGVVERLLDNAVKYSPEGGDIAVSVQRQEGDFVVAITDQGLGLSATQRRHLFECFYRAHAETPHDVGGLGVGLFLARQIVQLHDGAIGFESREGRGSTFWFRLRSAAT